MELILLRHGPAGGASEWAKTGRPDDERPLTKDGRRKTRAAAAGLAQVLKNADVVATSPWTRAAQTAVLAAKALDARVKECPALVPGRPFEELAAWLKAKGRERAVLVGHEPHLSRFASWLMTGSERPILSLKKSQAVLLELGVPAPGRATLVWSLTPKQLRALA